MEKDKYQLRWIQHHGNETPTVMMQHQSSPLSGFIAFANVYLLLNDIALDRDTTEIDPDVLAAKILSHIQEKGYTGDTALPSVDKLMADMKLLIDKLDPCCTEASDFGPEYIKELHIFNLTGFNLYHGCLLNPAHVRNWNFNSCAYKALKVYCNSLSDERDKAFLHQKLFEACDFKYLTSYGVRRLRNTLDDDDIALMFIDGKLRTVTSYGGQIYLLNNNITDSTLATKFNMGVWQLLSTVREHCFFVDSDFLSRSNLTARGSVSTHSSEDFHQDSQKSSVVFSSAASSLIHIEKSLNRTTQDSINYIQTKNHEKLPEESHIEHDNANKMVGIGENQTRTGKSSDNFEINKISSSEADKQAGHLSLTHSSPTLQGSLRTVYSAEPWAWTPPDSLLSAELPSGILSSRPCSAPVKFRAHRSIDHGRVELGKALLTKSGEVRSVKKSTDKKHSISPSIGYFPVSQNHIIHDEYYRQLLRPGSSKSKPTDSKSYTHSQSSSESTTKFDSVEQHGAKSCLIDSHCKSFNTSALDNCSQCHFKPTVETPVVSPSHNLVMAGPHSSTVSLSDSKSKELSDTESNIECRVSNERTIAQEELFVLSTIEPHSENVSNVPGHISSSGDNIVDPHVSGSKITHNVDRRRSMDVQKQKLFHTEMNEGLLQLAMKLEAAIENGDNAIHMDKVAVSDEPRECKKADCLKEEEVIALCLPTPPDTTPCSSISEQVSPTSATIALPTLTAICTRNHADSRRASLISEMVQTAHSERGCVNRQSCILS